MRPSNECVELYAEQCESFLCSKHQAHWYRLFELMAGAGCDDD